VGPFREALRELGYIEGKSLLIDVLSAEGDQQRLQPLAAELVRTKPDIIVAYQTPAVVAAHKATSTIPIIMAPAGDPVGTGLVKSLARPGGNITGLSGSTGVVAAKALELIRDIRPQARHVGVLANATDSFTESFLASMKAASRKLRLELHIAMVRDESEFDAAFREWSNAKVDAVVVQPSLPRKRPIALAQKYRLPSVSPSAPFAVEGGLMSYANTTREISLRSAMFVDRILKGANPADLPVEEPTLFELIVNLKTAKALGITFPPSIVARADRVIQ
jgi:putative ABC transport system substrate-binding protein